ncbi:hypothetical protein K438DRAFT_1782808 [Mycena galopus ATCC 62051]|nr:hypothetical protein K438DRAFT_1782808 [Mycena galopus ATCC 62051]
MAHLRPPFLTQLGNDPLLGTFGVDGIAQNDRLMAPPSPAESCRGAARNPAGKMSKHRQWSPSFAKWSWTIHAKLRERVTKWVADEGIPRISAPPAINEDVAMPEAGDIDERVAEPRAYLGIANCNTNITTSVHLAESPVKGVAGRDYLAVPSAHWPIGMRITPADVAATSTAAPLPADIAAWLTINALAPMRGDMTAIHRNTFMWKTMLIFSVPGYYDHYTHGITTGSPAVKALESFSCSRHNSFLHKSDLQRQTFEEEWLRTVEDILLTTLGTEDMWTALQHGPIRDGIDTFYPNFPAQTMDLDVATMANCSSARHPPRRPNPP